MTQAYVPTPQYAPPPPSRTSGMAVASLICSLILCCPGLSLLGILFGLLGLSACTRPNVRGRGLAIAGLLISLLVTAGYVAAGFAVYKGFNVIGSKIMEPVRKLVDDYNAGRDRELYDRCGPDFQKSVSFAEFRGYMAKARAEYGKAEVMGLIEMLRSGKPAQVENKNGRTSFSLPIRFEKVGVKRLELLMDEQGRFTSLSIEGLGELSPARQPQQVGS